jgi:reactive intermediate/imine deaminase
VPENIEEAGGMQVAQRQEFRVDGLNEPISHYTDAVRFGDMLFVSGVAALDDSGRVTSDDVVIQAQQIFENLKRILDAAGADFSDVLKVTVFMTDVRDRTKINPLRQKFFGNSRPASTLIGVNELAVPGMKIEIEAIVGLPKAGL